MNSPFCLLRDLVAVGGDEAYLASSLEVIALLWENKI